MNYSFEYIDIILLAMIAGFIFLRLRGILGKKTGHEENLGGNFAQDIPRKREEFKNFDETSFDEKAKTDFLKGAKIAYESIITDFSAGNLKNIKNSVPYGDRSNTIIEPLLTEQWFVDAKFLAKKAIQVVKKKKTKFFPAR